MKLPLAGLVQGLKYGARQGRLQERARPAPDLAALLALHRALPDRGPCPGLLVQNFAASEPGAPDLM